MFDKQTFTIPAIGIANKTPTNPNKLAVANAEKIIHTGCNPMRLPIILGVRI